MERLILLLLSPAILAVRHDPNGEPFLPIHPVYPYSPRLMKRGAEREPIPELSPELYAPRADAKDSYGTGPSNNNYQRDPYYDPNYDPYAKDASAPSPAYPAYYGGDAYTTYTTNSPYAAYAPYPAPYAANPASYPAAYPDYYYQPPYYYPHYFNHALYSPSPPPQPPSPPSSQPQPSQAGVEYHETPQSPVTANDDKQVGDERGTKSKEDEANRDASSGQFVDGGNYISGNTKDLDVQSSTYKTASPYNQLNVQAKNLPAPAVRTTYRVISVAGQPVGPDYPLPAAYVKAQTEQLSQTIARLLAQSARQQQADQSYETAADEDASSDVNGSSYANQNAYDQNAPSYVTLPSVRTKNGVTYVISANGVAKINRERARPQAATPSSSLRTTSGKNAKYSNVAYARKPTSSQATYAVPSNDRNEQRDRTDADSPPTDRADEYDGYDSSPSYDASGASSQSGNKQDYENYQSQTGGYRGKDFVAASQTPRTYTYQYSAYEPDQTTAEQPQEVKINSDDSNVETKQYNKE